MLKKLKKLFLKILYFFFPKKDFPIPEIEESTEEECIMKIADPTEFKKVEKIIQTTLKRKRAKNQIYEIPICVHVIHKGEPIGTGSNIHDSQVYSAINGLNEDFSKELLSRGDGNWAKTPFRFMLINKDDKGNPTNGIYRVNGAALSEKYKQEGIKASWGSVGENEQIVKNYSIQNNQHCCNLWIVTEMNNNNGGSGIQGFAYFPTTSMVDGIVTLYNATGKYPHNYITGVNDRYNLKSYTNLNRTLTHEMGHYLGLMHTFQGNSCSETNCQLEGDRVCDTPPTIKNSNGKYPACNGTQMVENYMDYTNQTYKNAFTQGQVDRMILAFENSRTNLMFSDALDNLSALAASASISFIHPDKVTCPGSKQYVTVKITNTSQNPIHKIKFKITQGENIYFYIWWGPIPPQGNEGYDYVTLCEFNTDHSKRLAVEIVSINNLPYYTEINKDIIIPKNDAFKIKISQDMAMGQITWNIKEVNSNTIYYASPQYVNFKAGTIKEHMICLPDGDYILSIIDIYPGMESPEAYIKFIDPKEKELLNITDTLETIEYSFTVTNGLFGDINKDGKIDLMDLSALNVHYNTKIGDPNYNSDADLNKDGIINALDLSILNYIFSKT